MSGPPNTYYNRVISLENVQDEVDEAAVRGYLGSVGRVIKVQFWNSNSDKRHAFVTFETADAAKQALHLVNDPGCRLPIKPLNKNSLSRYEFPVANALPRPTPTAPLQDRLRSNGAAETPRTVTTTKNHQHSILPPKPASAVAPNPHDRTASNDPLITHIHGMLATRTKQLEDSKLEVERLEITEERLNYALDVERKSKDELQQSYWKLTEDLKVMSGELQYFRSKVDQAASNSNHERDVEVIEKRYKGEVRALMDEVKLLRTELGRKDQVIADCGKELSELKQTYKTLQRDYARLSDKTPLESQSKPSHVLPSSNSNSAEMEDGEWPGDAQSTSHQVPHSLSNSESVEVGRLATYAELEKAYFVLDEITALALKAPDPSRELTRKKRKLDDG